VHRCEGWHKGRDLAQGLVRIDSRQKPEVSGNRFNVSPKSPSRGPRDEIANPSSLEAGFPAVKSRGNWRGIVGLIINYQIRLFL